MAASSAPRRWRLLAGAAAVVLLGASAAAIVWWRLEVPRCDAAPLEALGRDLADDDPVYRLDRVAEVVETLHESCEVATLDLWLLTAEAYRHDRHSLVPRGPWQVSRSERYGCADAPDQDIQDEPVWRHCIELGGWPDAFVEYRVLQPDALWSQLLLEDLGVSRTAAQQLVWVLNAGRRLPPGDIERDRVHSPLVSACARVPDPDRPTIIGPTEVIRRDPQPSSFIIDREVTVARLREQDVSGPAFFHANCIALGDAFPLDAWIPLRIRWQPPAGGAEPSHAQLQVSDQSATWGEIMAAAMEIAPKRCLTGADPLPEGCDAPWVTLWLSAD